MITEFRMVLGVITVPSSMYNVMAIPFRLLKEYVNESE